uniref:Uncharacterized protein n=1 Tax=Meloidogyne enterolobii TaxID=390850 RepID=A0A6V7VEZ6_MELEN|nr:unnamed protein product [Meloidogyne enterolobii]
MPDFSISRVNVLVDLIGIPFFLILVYVTIKHKKLQGTCHKLIGVYAACCILAKIQILPPFIIMITKINVPLWLCALIDILPIAGSFNIYSLMLVIAIDRILSIFFPIWYSSRGDSFHFPFMYGISSLFPLTFIIFVIITTLQDPMRQNFCFLSDLITLKGEENFHVACLVFNWTTVACYILLILKVFWEGKKGKLSTIKMALFKSLFLIMGIQIGGWMFSSIGFYLVDKGFIKKFNEKNNDLIGISINCISSLSSTFEVPAVFLSSSEHRKALKKTLGYETSSVYQMTVHNKISPNKNPVMVQPATPKNIQKS